MASSHMPSSGSGMNRYPIHRQGRRPLSIGTAAEHGDLHKQSPLAPATTVPHLPSPIAPLAKSPNFVAQPGAVSPSFQPTTQPHPIQSRPQQHLRQQFSHAHRPGMGPNGLSSGHSSASGSSMNSISRENHGSFVSPFQNHYDQLGKSFRAIFVELSC